jgi:hypothetical protein
MGAFQSGCGAGSMTTCARAGAWAKPMSRRRDTRALRSAVEVPPKTVAMIRTSPRCAEAVRL